jgi:type IX secretion system PorP/SprF family membrane protein
MKFRILLIFFIFSIKRLCAQDVHFTQFLNAHYTINPASTGNFDGQHRLTANHRTQWASVTTPFLTSGINYEMANIAESNVNGALSIYHDMAGASRFSTLQVNLAGSYIKKWGANNDELLSIGLQTGISQRSLNPGNLSFDSQYDAGIYDPSLNSGENIYRVTLFYMNFNSGILYQKFFNEKNAIKTGLAIYNINAPDQSLIDNERISLDRRFNFFVSSQFKITDDFSLLPSLLYMRQKKYQELMLGSSLAYYTKDRSSEIKSLRAGLFYRHRDAMIILLGFDTQDFAITASYDINISAFKPATNRRGAFEIALIYTIQETGFAKKKFHSVPRFL